MNKRIAEARTGRAEARNTRAAERKILVVRRKVRRRVFLPHQKALAPL